MNGSKKQKSTEDDSLGDLTTPGQSKGLLSVFHYRYLLSLIVQKDLRVRYRGSYLGMIWTYIKPLTQFFVYYVVMGIFLGLSKRGENYALYLFSGMIVVNYFTETFRVCTRSIRSNRGLVKKIYLPRELFPVSSQRVAMVHFWPQVAILFLFCVINGWFYGVNWRHIVAIVLGFATVSVFGLALGILFGALNVFYQDAENFVDVINMLSPWLSPIMYKASVVSAHLPDWLMHIYLLYPVTASAELFHYGFWYPTTDQTEALSSHLLLNGGIGFGIACVLLFIAEAVFKRLDGRFAQEL
ncbi:MAG: ABC transporter permease [Bifidobacteriaceae bacterium]|nr:ABC transporter permease [Bifidobacteriaceae bacterium]MCI1979430.1 ABC transporter permease [Bifidobacteriaceae bacterium]